MSENLSVRALIEAVAGPRQWSDTRQSWLSRAARRSGLTYRTIRGVFYGEITNESHPAIQLLRHTAGDTGPAAHARRLETIANGLAATDPDYFGPDIAALVSAIRALRGLDLSRDDKI